MDLRCSADLEAEVAAMLSGMNQSVTEGPATTQRAGAAGCLGRAWCMWRAVLFHCMGREWGCSQHFIGLGLRPPIAASRAAGTWPQIPTAPMPPPLQHLPALEWRAGRGSRLRDPRRRGCQCCQTGCATEVSARRGAAAGLGCWRLVCGHFCFVANRSFFSPAPPHAHAWNSAPPISTACCCRRCCAAKTAQPSLPGQTSSRLPAWANTARLSLATRFFFRCPQTAGRICPWSATLWTATRTSPHTCARSLLLGSQSCSLGSCLPLC